MARPSLGLAAIALLLAAAPAPAEPLHLAGGRGERAERDRDRAREACREEARRRDFDVLETGTPRSAGEGRLLLRMELERDGRRWLGLCSYAIRTRRADLETRRLDRDRDRRDGDRRDRGGARAEKVHEACTEAVYRDARYQILSVGRLRRRGDVSFLPMTIFVELSQREVTCVFDHRTGIATIR